MNPEDIAKRFGDESLRRLYDVIFDRPLYEMANWILMHQSEDEIKAWLDQLDEDDDE